MVVGDEEMVETNSEDDKVKLKGKIRECLKMIGVSNIDHDFFVDAGVLTGLT